MNTNQKYKISFDLWVIGLLYVLACKWIYGASEDFNSIFDYALFIGAIIVLAMCLVYLFKNAVIERYRYLVFKSSRNYPLKKGMRVVLYGLGFLVLICSCDWVFMPYYLMVISITLKIEK